MYIWFLFVFFETLIDLVSYLKTVTSQNRSNSGLLCRGPPSLESVHLWAHSSASWLKQAAIFGAFKVHNAGMLQRPSWASDVLWCSIFPLTFSFVICPDRLSSQSYFPTLWVQDILLFGLDGLRTPRVRAVLSQFSCRWSISSLLPPHRPWCSLQHTIVF